MDKDEIARRNILRESEEVSGTKVEGYDFDKGVNYGQIMKSYGSMGAQATHLSRAIEIVNKMIENEAFIYLGSPPTWASSVIANKKISRNELVEISEYEYTHLIYNYCQEILTTSTYRLLFDHNYILGLDFFRKSESRPRPVCIFLQKLFWPEFFIG